MGNMEENKIHWEALGFPVWLVGFKMKKVRGNEVPDVNMKKIQGQAFKALILHQHRFTGSQVRFIRSYLRLTQNEFAREINVNHSSVSIWESKGDDLTGMETNTELILRLYMLHSHGSPHFRKAVHHRVSTNIRLKNGKMTGLLTFFLSASVELICRFLALSFFGNKI
jgi:DNA-binding transcriptional regulator YiaG